MQNTTTTPAPKPDGDIQRDADGKRIYVHDTFTTTMSGFKQYNPSDHPPWGSPAETIVEAIDAGDLAKVSSLVADASYSPAGYLEIALITAVKADQLEIGRYLLDHGARMDKPANLLVRVVPGSYAATFKSLPFLKLFVERGWDVNYLSGSWTALFLFIRDHESVAWLLAHGADPNLSRVGNGIIYDGHLLDMAALCSTVEILDELIAHGARLQDSLALHHAAAAARSDTRFMARLLHLGVDINEPDDKGSPKNGSIGAPIFWAIRESRIANLKFLIENGADVNAKAPYSGSTPLEVAKRWGQTEIAEYLESLSPSEG